MDRKIIATFIVIYTFAAGVGYAFGETDTVSVPSVDVEKTNPDAVRSESNEAVAPDYRQSEAEVSDIVQLPTIIVRPEAVEEQAVEDV